MMKRKPTARAPDMLEHGEHASRQPSEAEAKKLERAVTQLQREDEARRARMSAEERAADDAARADRLTKARASHEAWMKDPPWFVFYEPYSSVIGVSEPTFVDHRGNALKFRNVHAATQLLGLTVSAKNELLMGASITHDEWNTLLAHTKRDVQGMKEDIPLDRIRFVDPSGRQVQTPGVDDLSDFSVVSIVHQCAMLPRPPHESGNEGSDFAWLRNLWCMTCLRQVDDAVLACLYADAGDGITASIRATEALWYAKSLTRAVVNASKPSVDARALGRQRGTEARKILYARAQKWAWDRWIQEAAEYEHRSSKAAPIYVRLIAREFQTARGAALTVTADTVKAWLKSPPGEE